MEEILLAGGYTFSLILFRMVGFFILVPILGSGVIPRRVRIGLIIFITAILWPVIDFEGVFEMPLFPLQLFNEFSRGLMLGFVAMLIFATLQLAGQFLDLRMGFAIVNVMDPLHGRPMPLMGQFKNLMGTLIFLLLDGHHQLLIIFYNSFERAAPGSSLELNRLVPLLMRFAGDVFILAFRVAIPLVLILFIVDVAFGFLARTVPQINIFIVGLPTKILLGFIVLYLSWPLYYEYLVRFFYQHFDQLRYFLRQMG